MIDLDPTSLATVKRILAEHVPGYEVRAFGSRATWTAWDYSDLDLVIVGDEPVPQQALGQLREAFEDSTLPICIDILDWHTIPEEWQRNITASHAVLQSPSASPKWHATTLGECVVMNDDTASPKQLPPRIDYLDTGSITNNRIDKIEQLVAGHDKIPTRARRRVREGDIVYSMVRPNQRHHGMLRGVSDELLVSTGFTTMHGLDGIADTRFVYWYLTQNSVVEQLQAIAEHSTSAYPAIRPSELAQLPIRLPPLDVQRRIAQVLGALDDRIELNRRMSRTLEEMAQALFQSWFVNSDPVHAKAEGRPTGLPSDLDALFPDTFQDSELGPIPAGWTVVPIGEAIAVHGGNTPSTSESEYWGDKYNFATPKDLAELNGSVLVATARQITDRGIARIFSGLLPTDTVLMSSRVPIGYLAVTAVPVAIHQGIIAMVCGSDLGSLYALHWMRTNMHQIRARASGTTFAEIGKSAFRQMLITIPDMAVHNTWNSMATNFYGMILEIVRQSKGLVEQRDALLSHLLSRKFRVPRDDTETRDAATC
ncbi:restriction endonuclease subunit S [Candidatus Poriferisodalis sp.]|uniref:restriction endonuclease subunit S n=1 Tax=Candidatus Poriferisodalis sp. TaxID=3101277 RepID=UPI003B01C2D4